VNVTWDIQSKVNLQVVEPSGDEIYFGDTGPSATGGPLEWSRMPVVPSTGNEHNSWPNGRALRGSYPVQVNYRSASGVSKTN
jgi:uncharacterized protein YfaP (DUF2135 family)